MNFCARIIPVDLDLNVSVVDICSFLWCSEVSRSGIRHESVFSVCWWWMTGFCTLMFSLSLDVADLMGMCPGWYIVRWWHFKQLLHTNKSLNNILQLVHSYLGCSTPSRLAWLVVVGMQSYPAFFTKYQRVILTSIIV